MPLAAHIHIQDIQISPDITALHIKVNSCTLIFQRHAAFAKSQQSGGGRVERPHRGEEPELENERAGFLTVCSGLFILTDIPAAQGPSQRLKSQAFQVIQTIFFQNKLTSVNIHQILTSRGSKQPEQPIPGEWNMKQTFAKYYQKCLGQGRTS